MTEEMISQVIVGLPNFAGFSIALLLMYRSLAQAQQNNRVIVNKLIDCWESHLDNKKDTPN